MKDVNGYEDNYLITTDGKVYSKNYKMSGKVNIIKQRLDRYGYPTVCLSKNGTAKHCKVHRLVALTYLYNPLNKTQVNHINEDKTDNSVTNLEWATPKENINHGTGIYRAHLKQKNNHLSRKVYQYSLEGNLVKIWASTREAKRGGYNLGAIWKCNNDKLKTHKGYRWEYESSAKHTG